MEIMMLVARFVARLSMVRHHSFLAVPMPLMVNQYLSLTTDRYRSNYLEYFSIRLSACESPNSLAFRRFFTPSVFSPFRHCAIPRKR